MSFLKYQVAQKRAKWTGLNQGFVCDLHVTDIILVVVVLLATSAPRVNLEAPLGASYQQIKFIRSKSL
jgi:hypothetical protein